MCGDALARSFSGREVGTTNKHAFLQSLIDYLEGGHSLSEFLQQFPTVTQEMAARALEEAKESLFARIA